LVEFRVLLLADTVAFFGLLSFFSVKKS
jgi:hypothetical protein